MNDSGIKRPPHLVGSQTETRCPTDFFSDETYFRMGKLIMIFAKLHVKNEKRIADKIVQFYM